MDETPFWHAMLPTLGMAEEFQKARGLFEQCGFDYAKVCGVLGVDHLYLLTAKQEGGFLSREGRDGLDALIRLFVIGRGMERTEALRLLGADGVECLEALGLLAATPGIPGGCFSPVMVHPTPSGPVMVCDRSMTPDGAQVPRAAADALYPALFANTMDFVARFPETPCDRILEIGTGTGTAAIAWSRRAGEVWATDIADRAVCFAEFNRRLAGADNVRVVKGDMYEPVEGMTFDRIASHPPFVPARKSAVIFRDGGEDGEQLARRVLEGLPRFLRPGGLFWGSFMISDRAGESAEQRIRKWLGECESEFDIGFAMDGRKSPAETISLTLAERKGPLEEVAYFGELWRDTHTEFLIHAAIIVRRKAAAVERPAVTVRVQTGQGFSAHDLERLMDWEVAQQEPGCLEKLLEDKLALVSRCELRASHQLEDGTPVSEDYTFVVDTPIRSACRVPPWAARLLVGSDGSRTGHDLFEAVKEGGHIAQDADPLEFARMMAGLIAAGVIKPGAV